MDGYVLMIGMIVVAGIVMADVGIRLTVPKERKDVFPAACVKKRRIHIVILVHPGIRFLLVVIQPPKIKFLKIKNVPVGRLQGPAINALIKLVQNGLLQNVTLSIKPDVDVPELLRLHPARLQKLI